MQFMQSSWNKRKRCLLLRGRPDKQSSLPNASLSSELLGLDVNDDNFAERMVALINQRKRAFAEQTAKEKRDKPMTPTQQRIVRVFVKTQIEKIRMAVADHKVSRTQKDTENELVKLWNPDTQRSKSLLKPPFHLSRITKPKSILTELDLDADDKTFIKVVSDEDSEDEAPILWSTFARVDRHDLLKLYGLVVKYYENHPVTGAGLVLWGDLQVLFDSQEGDVSYPLSVKLMERMLKHNLEIAKDVVGNDMTTAEQLIWFSRIKLAQKAKFT
ncbi:hypothetical protein Tco_0009781 [Tanacetum coccineum]